MPHLTIGRIQRDLMPISPSFLAEQLSRIAVKGDIALTILAVSDRDQSHAKILWYASDKALALG